MRFCFHRWDKWLPCYKGVCEYRACLKCGKSEHRADHSFIRHAA